MTEHQTLTVRLHPNDNVVTARIDLLPNTAVAGEDIACSAPIPAGHKVATRPIAKGEPVRKYDQIIGFASADIAPGEHVHTQNVEMQDFARDYAFGADAKPVAFVAEDQRASFQGFLRASGRAGTRNFIGVLSTVNCSATVCHHIAETFPRDELAAYGNVDGIVALTHGTGCGMADRGEGFATLQRTLWGYARHPNFAGVLMVGLGCEVNQIDFLLDAYQIQRGPHFRTMTMQGLGGTRKTVERAQAMIREMLPHANEARRQPDRGLGDLARAAVRRLGRLFRHDREPGARRLRRSPGAPRRHRDPVGDARDLRRRASAHAPRSFQRSRRKADRADQVVGGLLRPQRRRDEQQPLARQQGGRAHHDPREVARRRRQGRHDQPRRGLQIRRADQRARLRVHGQPGLRPCSATGQVASGGNVICFTTGRGSCFGFKPAPSIKLATNTEMYRRMEEDMDVNCGIILDGEVTLEQMGQQIFDLILEVASGRRTKSETLGLGNHEFTPWQIGAVM